jgi:hypothetical protein
VKAPIYLELHIYIPMILSVISQHKTPNFLSIAHLKLETTNQTLRLPPFPNPKPVSEPWQRLFHRHFLAPPCRSVIGGPHKIGKLAYTYDPTGGHGRYIFRWICQKIGLSSLSEDLGKKGLKHHEMAPFWWVFYLPRPSDSGYG